MRLQPLFLALCAALNRARGVRCSYPPLSSFNARSIRLRGSGRALDDDLLLVDLAAAKCVSLPSEPSSAMHPLRSPLCSSKRGEPVVYESIGNGVDSKQITPKDDATVKCICGTCDDDGERMVCCDKCQNWLHTRCIGLDDGKEIPPDFSLTQFLRVK